MRIMALDVGDKRIGVSVSDALLLTAQPRPTLERKDLKSDIDRIGQLLRENEVSKIIVGRPVHMDGRETLQTHKVERFAARIASTLAIPVIFWDERLTSFAAEQHLEEMGLNWRKRRRHVDRLAAMLILQNYLDSCHS